MAPTGVIPTPTLNVSQEISRADIVVGYGRSILEAMSCGLPAYVHEHSGSDGWVTASNYAILEADGFAGSALRPYPNTATLRDDFGDYSPDHGRVGQDLIRMHHDLKIIAAQLIQHISGMGVRPVEYDPKALNAIARLMENHGRAEERAEKYRVEAKAAATLWKLVNLPARLAYKIRRRTQRIRHKFRKPVY